ncbi:MAG TPA: RodZ domain-containing protein [Woeseiaceae bacterium]|nr:RodZ domain-containing protein [Woeseiaceae bacterium]
MTDEKDKPDDEAPEAKAEGPLGGERLAEARRAKQISVLEIAKELHVEEAKIRALENNDFDILGAPVFAKGHLKKYSQLVGVNHDDVLADYYRLTRAQEMPPVIVSRQKPKRELSPGPLVAAIIVLVLVAVAYWLLIERPFATPPVPAAVPSAAPAPASTSEPEPLTDTGPAGDTGAGEEPAAEPPPESPADEPDPVPAETQQQALPVVDNTAAPAAGEVRLSVTFLGDCWTEITDATGRRLYFQLGRSGRTVNVSGPAPLTVLFGDADNVDVRVNGEDFTIPAANRRGRTARLTIAGT